MIKTMKPKKIRQLDDQEKEKTAKGIKVVKERIGRIEKSIVFNELTIRFQKAQDEYQEAVRPYLQGRKKEENDKLMDSLVQTLAMEKDNLKNLNDQIANGVVVKQIVEDK